jgi:hypothetical protein
LVPVTVLELDCQVKLTKLPDLREPEQV